jgi:hypothetical protein
VSQWISPRSTKVLRDEFHWDTFDNPPYSLDLAPSDFHLFLKMKEHLAGKRHADDEFIGLSPLLEDEGAPCW